MHVDDGAATPDGTGPTQDGGAVTTADGAVDGSAPTSPCATGTHLFCADFEDAPTGFSMSGTGCAVATGSSGNHALQCSLTASSAASSWGTNIALPTPGAVLQFDLSLVVTGASTSQYWELDAILANMRSGGKYGLVGVPIYATDTVLEYTLALPDGGVAYPAVSLGSDRAGKVQHYKLTFTSKTAQVTATVDGVPANPLGLPDVVAPFDLMQLSLGAGYAALVNLGQNASIIVKIDNVVVDAL